jgi:hypothetical protein
VSDLAATVDDKQLHAIFAPFGAIESAKVMLHIHTGVSRGIAFVKFATHDEAVAAVIGLNKIVVDDGQRLSVRFADVKADFRPGCATCKVFVRNVPRDIPQGDVVAYFTERVGPVTECSMHIDTAASKAGGTASKKSVAYVSFATVGEAKRAAGVAHGAQPFASCDVPLMAKVAESDTRRCERHMVARQRRGGGAAAADEAAGVDAQLEQSGDAAAPSKRAARRQRATAAMRGRASAAMDAAPPHQQQVVYEQSAPVAMMGGWAAPVAMMAMAVNAAMAPRTMWVAMPQPVYYAQQ